MKEYQPYGIFDFSELPVVKVSYTEEKISDENFADYLEEMGTVFEKAERYIMLFDTTHATYMPVKHRIEQGKYLEKNEERIKRQSIAVIFIAPSFLHRTVLKAIFMIKPHPSEVFFVSTEEEARKKVEELLEKEKELQSV